MHNVRQVIMKFKEPCWPKDLHGMIMVDDDFLLPEVWFRHVPDEVEEGEPTAYAVGFTTAKYTERLMALSQDEVGGWAVNVTVVIDTVCVMMPAVRGWCGADCESFRLPRNRSCTANAVVAMCLMK
jgi:hypothetical protein